MGKQKGTNGKPPNGNAPAANNAAERLPAYFLSLSLENVRCFGPKQTLDLSDGKGKPARWTIILGLNGTGKTTLLQSLVGFEQRTPQKPPDPLPDFWGRFLARYRDDPHLYRRGDRTQQSEWAITVGGSHSLTAAPIASVECSLTMGQIGAVVMAPRGKPFNSLWCCAYGASRRVGSVTLREGEADDPTATLFSDRAELRNAEEWLLQLDYAAKSLKDKDAQHRLSQATELLLAIMPEDEITDIRFATTGGPNPKARAEFKTPYGWVPLRQLGYGYQTLITWVADLTSRMAERYPDSANPLVEPAVVLVDEIDLHLHPKWQRKLMGFLTERFPNTQFIATAHSPLVVQAAADANLAVLRREGDHVIIDNEVDNIRNLRVDQILTSDLFGLETARPPHIEALLLERKALLTKPKQTAADKRRLEELESLIGELPFGETAQERKEREEIRKTLDLLMKERKPAS
jgi:hypothetical protein